MVKLGLELGKFCKIRQIFSFKIPILPQMFSKNAYNSPPPSRFRKNIYPWYQLQLTEISKGRKNGFISRNSTFPLSQPSQVGGVSV